MVERYDIDVDGCDCCEVVEYVDTDGDWVKYEDYSKLADLCGRMAVLLECAPVIELPSSRSKDELKKAISEWEAMK